MLTTAEESRQAQSDGLISHFPVRCRPPFLTATYSLLSNRWTLQSVEILFVRGGGVWGKMLLKGLVRFKIQVSSSYQVLVGASITYLYSPREALGYSSYILSSPLFQFPFSPRAVGSCSQRGTSVTCACRGRGHSAGLPVLLHESALQSEAGQQRAFQGELRLKRKEICLFQPLYLVPSRQYSAFCTPHLCLPTSTVPGA